MFKKITFSLLATAMLFAACTKENLVTYDCTGLTPTYTSSIKSIMDNNCAISGCHNASTEANGINLSTFNGVSAAASNNSFLGSIEHSSGYNPMPENAAKLSTTSRQAIYCWIQNGKPN